MDPTFEGGLFTVAGAALGSFLTGALGLAAWRVVSRRRLHAALIMLRTELMGNREQIKVALMALQRTDALEIPQLSRALFDAFGPELLGLPMIVRAGILGGYAHVFAPRVLEKRIPNGPATGSLIVHDAEKATNNAIELIDRELALPAWPARPVARWMRSRADKSSRRRPALSDTRTAPSTLPSAEPIDARPPAAKP